MPPKNNEQLTDTVLMIEPTQFGFNAETAITNSFQSKPDEIQSNHIQIEALKEFKNFVHQLKEVGISVIVHKDTNENNTPDSIFPNNWISTHSDGTLFTYPMATSNRRAERNPKIVQSLQCQFGFTHINLSDWENEEPARYLEGTGSMIFDRPNKRCYAALSPRTNNLALSEFSQLSDFEIISFESYGKSKELIYHTNVMLSVGESFVCVGLNTIHERDRTLVIRHFQVTDKEIIDFTNEQIYTQFAGNMLQLKNDKAQRILVMSNQIFLSMTDYQREKLEMHNDILLPINIPTIELVGGGSVRCMMAEIFKPAK